MASGMKFNPPPGWAPPPSGWTPAPDWRPDPSWPPAPTGWVFWVPDDQPEPESPSGTEALAVDNANQGAPTPAVPSAPQAETPVSTPQPSAEPAPAPVSIAATEDQPAAQVAEEAGRHAPGAPPVAAETTLPAVAPPQDQPTPAPTEAPDPSVARQELLHIQTQVAQEREKLSDLRRQVEAEQARSPTPAEDGEAGQIVHDIEAARRELIELNDAVLLQQVGIYEYHHPLENADAYKERLADIRDRIKDAIRSNKAIDASDRFAYNNSLAQGRKMTADFSKLMLRAYNAEADNCVRSLRAGSIDAAIKRLDTSIGTIARLGSMMQMHVTPEYHALRLEELELTSDYLFKVQEEREQAREERERLREQRKAEQELAAERDRLEKERQHYANALAALQAKGGGEDGDELAQRLAAIDAAIEMNDYRTANIRAGYVYVISNIGAFGSRVVKIGMTRRLEPMDRVRELGDASVPFPFDVHALYFSDDAVALEAQLHAAFADRRLNLVNLRREFFFATPAEVREVLKTKVGNLLEFAELPEATQFHQSQSEWPHDLPGGGSGA